LIFTTTGAESKKQFVDSSVINTLYVPLSLTVNVGFVSPMIPTPPIIHRYVGLDVVVTAVNSCVAGLHKSIGPVSDIADVGFGLTVMVTEDVVETSQKSVTVTVYVVVVVGFTVIFS